MTETHPRTFSSDFRRFFLKGLVTLLPTILTLWIVIKAYQFVDDAIAEPINRGVRVAMVNTARVWEPAREYFNPSSEALAEAVRAEATVTGQPPTDAMRMRVRGDLRARNISDWWRARWYMDFIGIVVALVAVYIAGRLLGGFFGRAIYRRLEKLITSLPVFKQVYPHVKQIVDFLFGDEQKIKFNRVVTCEYPRRGIWSVGFLTGDTLATVAEQSGDSVTIFIPSSPTPFTGYTITVPRAEVRELPITVEEAIRFTVSGGVLVPEHQRLDRQSLPPSPPAEKPPENPTENPPDKPRGRPPGQSAAES